MNNNIAYCGLDCSNCEARLATINNDNELRIKVAKKWSELNGIEITPEMINCFGCKSEGIKFGYCEICEIRKCAVSKAMETCGKCNKLDSCSKIKMIIDNNIDVYNRLKNEK